MLLKRVMAIRCTNSENRRYILSGVCCKPVDGTDNTLVHGGRAFKVGVVRVRVAAAVASSMGLATVAALGLGLFLNVGSNNDGGGGAPSIAANSSSSGGTLLASTTKYTASVREFHIECIHSQVFMM